MKTLDKDGTRKSEVHRARKELVFRISLGLAIVILLLGILVINRFRPQADPPGQAQDGGWENAPLRSEEARSGLKISREELAVMVEYFQGKATREILNMEDLESLESAIAAQKELLKTSQGTLNSKLEAARLEEMLALYDDHMGAFLLAQSIRFERENEGYEADGQYEKGLDAVNRALNLQRRINHDHPRSSARSSIREQRLVLLARYMETKPLADAADQGREEALSLRQAGRFKEAESVMRVALERQRELNENHRKSRFASMARLRIFERTYDAIRVAEGADSVKRLILEVESALQDEKSHEAQSKVDQAEVIQKRLMQWLPGLEETDPAILEGIQRLKETAASQLDFKQIEALGRGVRELLRSRTMEPFDNAVSEWFRLASRFDRRFPRSEYAAQIHLEETTFLHSRREAIPSILRNIHAGLIPVPGMPGISLYRTEVPQWLYSSVMENNPSLSIGSQLPVDSVSWEEANAFTRRLAWILARPVGLPDQDIFLMAMGDQSLEQQTRIAWSIGNTEGRTREVGTSQANAAGYFDLLGNAAEWLKSGPGTGPVTAIGGSVRDTPEALARMPREERSPTERNRFIGFRFMVEMEKRKTDEPD